MRLVRIDIREFMSHSQTTIEFGAEPVQIQARNYDHQSDGWSNGGGKSACLNAITWALWGRLPQSLEYKDDVIRHGCEETRVELHLLGSDGKLEIIRSKKRGSPEQLTAFLNNQRVPGDRDECQANLVKIYGISWKVYCNTIFLGPASEATQFVDATPAIRASLLAELVNYAPFEAAGEVASKELGVLTRRQVELTTILGQLSGQAGEIEATVQRISAAYRIEHAANQVKRQSTEAEITVLEQEGLRIIERLKVNPPETAVLIGQVNAQEEVVQGLEAKSHILRARIGIARPSAGMNCPSCNQPITAHIEASLNSARVAWRQELALREEEARQAREVLVRVRQDREAASAWENTAIQLRSRLEEIRGLVYKAKTGLESRSLAILNAELDKAKAARTRNQASVTEFQGELATVNDHIPVMQTIVKGLKSEIRNILLDDIRVGLSTHTTEYLEVLAEHEFTIKFPQTSKTGREEFHIQLFVGFNRPVASVGESYRAKLAILLALRRVLQQQAASSLDFLLIDDPLMGVDLAGDLAFAKLVSVLTRTMPQILITIPRAVEGLNIKTIFIERTGRVSRCIKI